MACIELGEFAKQINEIVQLRIDANKLNGMNHGVATKKALDDTYLEFLPIVLDINETPLTNMFNGKFGKDRVPVPEKSPIEEETPFDIDETLQEFASREIQARTKGTSAEKYANKEIVKAKEATQFIGNGKSNSSTDRYRKIYDEKGKANTGEYTKEDIVFVASNGNRSGAIKPVINGKLNDIYVNLDKAINAGSTIIMDTKNHLDKTSRYNTGEVALANYLSENGYERVGDSGKWIPKETIENSDSDQAPFDTEDKKEIAEPEKEMVPNYVVVFGEYVGEYEFQSKYFEIGPENYKDGKIFIPWAGKNGKKGNYIINLETGISGTKDWIFKDLIGYKPYVEKEKSSDYIEEPLTQSKEIDISSLNEGQTKAYNDMVEFLTKGDRKEHVLIGPGGTGKTFTINKVAEYLKNNMPYSNVVYLAPTHQAKITLSKSVNNNNTGAEINVNTITSALGLVMDEDGNFVAGGSEKISPSDILIIDEASMITEKQYSEIMNILASGSGKVIFMGDNAQLPPIRDNDDAEIAGKKLNVLNKEDSPAFGKNTKHHSVLSKVERFDENSKLGKIIAKLRDSVFGNPGKLLDKSKGIFDGEGYKDETSEVIYTDSIEDIENSFIEDYRKNPTGTRIITGNNEAHNHPASVMNLNMNIRKKLHPESTEKFVAGDTLIAYEGLIKNKTNILDKGMTYEVVEADPVEKKWFTGEAKKRNGSIHEESFEMEYQVLTLREAGNPDMQVRVAVPVPGSNGMQKFIDYTIDLNNRISKAYNEKDFSEGAKLRTEAMALQNMSQTNFGKLLFSYAMTAHKAQGSSVENTYVMGDNISNFGGSKYGNPKTQSQMIYVAASRTQKKLVIHGQAFKKKSILRHDSVKNTTTNEESDALKHIKKYYNAYAKNLIEKIKAEKKPEITMSTMLAYELLSGSANFGATSMHDEGSERIIFPDFMGLATKTDKTTLELKKEIMDKNPDMTDEEFSAWMKQMHTSDWINKTKVHEHIHTATSEFMENNPDDERTLYIESVYDRVLKFAKENPDHPIVGLKKSEKNPMGYWSQDVDEFIADALSQPEMIEFLSTHDLGMNIEEPEKSILSKIIEKILGMIYPREAIDNNTHKMLLNATISISEQKIQKKKEESLPEQDFYEYDGFEYDDSYIDDIAAEEEYRSEIYGSNYENMSRFFNTSLDDFIVSENEMNIEEDIFNVFNIFLEKDSAVLTSEEDYGKQRLGIYSQEFMQRVQQTLDKIKNTVSGLDTKNIKLTQISTSLEERFDAENEYRETAGKFRQKSNGESEIQIRWNRFNGTASQSEIFIHELIHYMTFKAFERFPKYREKLDDLRKTVLNSGSVNYTIFLEHYKKQNELGLHEDEEGNPIEVQATEAEIQIAKDKFNYVFSDAANPEEFFAYAMSNEFVYNAIKDIKITPKDTKLIDLIKAKDGKKLNFVYELLNTFIDIINDIWIGQSGRDKRGGEMVMDLFFELADKQAGMQKAMGREQNTVDKSTLQRLGEFVRNADEKIKPYIQEADNLITKISDGISKGSNLKKWIGKVDRATLLGRFIESDIVPEIWNSIVKKTDDKQWADIYQMFRVIKQQTEKYRTDLESSLNKVMDSYLENTSSGEKEIIASVVFKLDLKSLLLNGKHTLDEVFDILDNDAEIEKIIKKETVELQKLYKKRELTRAGAFTKNVDEFRSDLEQIDGLSDYLATGKFTINNQQMNAQNIYGKFYMTGSMKVDANQPITEFDAEIIEKIDQLITYKAMIKSSINDRVRMKTYMKENSNSKNIEKLIKLHDSYVKNSRKDLSKNNFDHIAKGAIKPKTTKRKFELVPEDMAATKRKLGMRGEEVYGVISGVKYIKMFGNSDEPGYTEGALSISNHRLDGISLKALLANQVRSRARENGEIISTAKVDETVNEKMEKIIKNGGKSPTISIRNGHHMVPVHDIMGKIVDYKMQMSKEDQHERMDYNFEVGEMLAYTFSDIAHQKIVTDKNKMVIRKLLSYSKKHFASNPDGFIILKPHESGSGKPITKANEKWNTIPDYTKDYIYELTGKTELAVPKEFLTLMVGYKNATLGNFNLLGFDMQNHENLRSGVLAAETYIAEVLGYLKRIIVVLNASVVGANTVSNMMVAMWHGMTPVEYIKHAKAMWENLDRYEELARKLSDYQVRSQAGEDVSAQIKQIKKQMKDNNFHYLVEDGQFSPIVEDINVDKQAKGHITQFISDSFKKNKMMEAVGEVADQLFVNRSTRLYAKALKVTQYGDIISREIIRQREEEKFEKRNGRPMNKSERQELLNYLDQLLVNYSYLDNKYLKWFETVAGLFFTKYLFRQGKALHRSFEKNPTLATLFELAQVGTGIDIPTPMDTFYNPLDALLNREQLADPIGVGMNIVTPNIFTIIPGFDSLGIKFN